MTAEDEVDGAYRRLGHLVRKRCRRILRDDALADDAMQEAFVRMWRFLPAYREATSKLAWIYRVADRCCFDLLARRRTRREDALDSHVLGATSTQQAIEDRDLAMKLLDELDDEARQIVVLFYLDEMSQGEIADVVGCSRQTVNKKLQDVRARLEQHAVRAAGGRS